MALYKETGTNPFASCLPLILQMPIFLALFRLIDHAAKGDTRGLMTTALAHQFANATLFGAKISDSFTSTHITGVRILAAVLVIAMTATTFTTQRQLMSKNMPADAMTGQYAQQQKMLLYVLPLVFAFGGIAFPIGVLFYWTTSNLWTMGQQFYVIRNNPAPGTPAAKAKEQRDAEKRERKGLTRALRGSGGSTDSSSGDPSDASADLAVPGSTAPTATPEPPAPRRQQPRKQSRSQRKRQPGRPPQPGRPGASGSTAASGGATSSERPDDEPGLNAS
jgi:YidC/Oxa1 family membrane protein insertase